MKRPVRDGQNIGAAPSAAVAMNRDEEGKKLLGKEAMHSLQFIPTVGANMVLKLGYKQP